jgi:hypothetical protein
MILTRRSALSSTLGSTLGGLATVTLPAGAFAQGNYPDKPIRMVIASPPAGRPTSSPACWRRG